jgi:hypothetical protein
LPDGAAFCSGCGRTQIPATRGSPIEPSARRSAQSRIAEIGVDRAICIVGGLLGLIGTVLPYFITSIPARYPASASPTLVSYGAPGLIVLLIAVVLGAGSIVFRPSRALSFAGIALSTLVLSKLLNDWFAVGYLQAATQSMASLAQSSDVTASQDFGVGAGAYCLLLGFVALFVAYVRLAGAPRTRKIVTSDSRTVPVQAP